jgi:hypothetical protein
MASRYYGARRYYKNTRDESDDGQFGAAVVLTQFNYARGYSEGGGVKVKYNNGILMHTLTFPTI